MVIMGAIDRIRISLTTFDTNAADKAQRVALIRIATERYQSKQHRKWMCGVWKGQQSPGSESPGPQAASDGRTQFPATPGLSDRAGDGRWGPGLRRARAGTELEH